MTIQDDHTSQAEGQGGAASQAADQGMNVAGTAKDRAADVAGTAAEQARTVAGDARRQVTTQLHDQATVQRDHLTRVLRSLGDDLEQMTEDGPGQGIARDLVREVTDRSRALGSHLEGREPGDLLQDARDFARRRPGTFLLGALAAGMVAGRLLRATTDGAAAATLDEPATGAANQSSPVPAPRAAPTGPGIAPSSTIDDALGADPTLGTPADTDPTASELPGRQPRDTP